MSPIAQSPKEGVVSSAMSKRVIIGNIDAQTATNLAEGLVKTTQIFSRSPFSWGVFFLGSAAFLAATLFGTAAIVRAFRGDRVVVTHIKSKVVESEEEEEEEDVLLHKKS